MTDKKQDLEIKFESTAKEIDRIIAATAKLNGLQGGYVQRERLSVGWIVAVIWSTPSGFQHWNYHPGRKTLQLTHTTYGHVRVADALASTIEALERLYPEA